MLVNKKRGLVPIYSASEETSLRTSCSGFEEINAFSGETILG